MKSFCFQFSILILLLTGPALQAQHDYDVLIKDVNVVDVKNGKSIAHQNVYLKADRIAKITSSASETAHARTVVDGAGKYLMPGLWDMHTHNWWQIHFSGYYVANGVLGVRNMYTPMDMVKPVKDSINAGLLIGPKYFAAGRVLEGPDPEFPDWIVVDSLHKIKPALDSLQMEGSDFVKVYNKIPRNVYFELVKEAHKRGMTVEGHLPMSVTAIEASNAGQKSFEHLLGIPDLCTPDTLFRNRYKNNWFAAVMKENDYGTLKFDEKLARKNFSILTKNQTYVCPTLVVWNSYFHPDTAFEKNELLQKLPADMVEFWLGELTRYRKKDSTYKAMALKKYETFKRTTYLLYKSGVPLLAGTDAMNPFCYPGFSLPYELQLLKECGIPDAEVLKMATLNPALFFNLKDYGQVKEGYVASLLLLDKNPLTDVRNVKELQTVFLKGKVIDKAALERLKK